ncbi:M81 family metallopeptidase [Frigidibacter sp. ROC022]|uniref:M81 family metallopeptidase n=1 Tax=Frigidibacter sp. ROC022 TaxID=2971796 RepID=UPI00215AFD08|nr:M81 family metallopeptidase [Frigidibacter sp. ROC022]MCR8726044.1 M81 family metallopeptidase [Frigidibacter sp. ROC022]
MNTHTSSNNSVVVDVFSDCLLAQRPKPVVRSANAFRRSIHNMEQRDRHETSPADNQTQAHPGPRHGLPGTAPRSEGGDMSAQPRILLAGIYHETHTFVRRTTALDDFRIRRGEELLARAGDGSTVDGFLEVAGEQGWAVVPVCEYSALPAGPIEHSVFEAFWQELESGLKAALAEAPLDAIWLALHGAGVTTDCDDIEGKLLKRIRTIAGAEALPIFAVFDLHANFTDAMARHATGLVGYRENPHTDARAAAVESARLLARTLREGVLPRIYCARVPLIWPPTGTATAASPMKDLEARARQIEAESPEIWSVSVTAGFAFSDVDSAGVAFNMVTTGSEAQAREALESLCDIAWRLRDEGQPDEDDLDTALEKVKARPDGPWIIVEPADNIGGGGPGDCTSILRGFLRHGIEKALVVISDPAAVAALDGTPPGGRRTLSIGGKGSPFDPGPVELEVTLVSTSDGEFDLEDRQSHMVASQGTHFSMGPTAVVRSGGVTIMLTSHKTPPNDLAQLRSQGLEPTEFLAIGVKAAVAHRRAYDKIAAGSYTVATPGPCTSDLKSLPYRKLRRPIYPLDPIGDLAPMTSAKTQGEG